jgi:hypothetical protein
MDATNIRGEKQMRKSTKAILGLAVGAILGFAGSANAAISVTSTRTAGTGQYAGQDIVRFFGAFAPGSPEALALATGLQSVKTTLTTPAQFQYVTGQFALPNNGATNPDVDLFGLNGDDLAYRTGTDKGSTVDGNAIGTGVFVHDPTGNAFSVQGLFVDGVSKATTANNSGGPATNGFVLFQNAKSVRVEGFVQQPGGGVPGSDPAALSPAAGTKGAGALFAVAVVPHLSSVNAQGIVAADKGPSTTFDVTDIVPEPGTLSVIGMGGMALLARRRRKA